MFSSDFALLFAVNSLCFFECQPSERSKVEGGREGGRGLVGPVTKIGLAITYGGGEEKRKEWFGLMNSSLLAAGRKKEEGTFFHFKEVSELIRF